MEYINPDDFVAKIDNEGWPGALEWFANENFEDKELDELLFEAINDYTLLENVYQRILRRLEALGIDVYI